MCGPYVLGIPGFGPIESLLYLGTVIICSNETEYILIMMRVFVQVKVNITILDARHFVTEA